MAFETEKGNIVTPTDEISQAITDAFVQKAVFLPLILMEPIPATTDTKKWRKDGSLAAEEIAESAAYTFSANSELTQSSVSSTARKFAVISKITVEALKFSSLTVDRMAELQGEALARDLDDEIKALFTSFTNQVIAASTLTADEVYDAEFTVRDSTAGVSEGLLRGAITYKQHNELQKDLTNKGADAFSSPFLEGLVQLLIEREDPAGFVGSLGGVDFYHSKGFPVDTGNDVGCVYDPMMAFGSMISEIESNLVWKGSEGLYWELSSHQFYDVVQYNDEAGVELQSDS